MPLVESPKPIKKKSLLTKIVLVVVAIVGLVAFGYVAVVILSLSLLGNALQQGHDEAKAQLAPEVTRFQSVQECTAAGKSESPEESEGAYYVELNYNCSEMKWGELEGMILSQLTSLGYPFDPTSWSAAETKNYSADMNSLLQYRSNCCNVTVSPSFVDKRFETSDIYVYKAEIVNGYHLTIWVNFK